MLETESNYRQLLRGLTAKERRFVEEYLVSCNSARAARTAGYSSHSAKEIGWENLTKPHIALAVRAGLAAIAARCEVDADKLMRDLAAVALSNIAHYRIDDEGHVALEEGAPPEALKALQSVRRKKIIKGDGSVVYETEYRLWDKLTAAALIGKKLKLFVEKFEVENAQDEVYKLLLREIRARPGGE